MASLRSGTRRDVSTYVQVLYRLNGKQSSTSFEDLASATKFRHTSSAVKICPRRSGRPPCGCNLTWIVEVCVGPGADDSARPVRLAAGRQQVIGALERDEAAWVAG